MTKHLLPSAFFLITKLRCKEKEFSAKIPQMGGKIPQIDGKSKKKGHPLNQFAKFIDKEGISRSIVAFGDLGCHAW
jgi:hypothetical protein